MILEIRRRLVVDKGQGLIQKAIFSVVNNRRLFHTMLRTASITGKPFTSGKFIRQSAHVPVRADGWPQSACHFSGSLRDRIKKSNSLAARKRRPSMPDA